ncbi:uncharacterized protein [Littorina saxatilis]|uniref:EF-hand domain-containing protein n=1 Tax=Littorina saxatilis TaxID=31220 RepID=A0AAN9B3M9_9CAEN
MMKISMWLLSLVVVTMLAVEGVSAQDWLERWMKNNGNGNIKKVSDSFQPTGVMDMLGYGTFARRSRRSADVEHKVDGTVETSESDKTTTSETDKATTSETDKATTSETDKATTSETDKALQQWRLMCPVINANTDIDTEQGPGLSIKTFDTVFRIADKNKDGRIDTQELDLYEKLIEAYELCRMLE